ncbi:HAMP domain-containing sensor histidine kinase [Paenibacillus sp. 3LSP]|uniref:sensor histidine kinase n=1 Tax=Paenibacillus sp. 3LSP TaxID=2800795 RepID=UPI0028FD6AD4|nr:HAMP domain-containing sensor histidine kinase [Paenibacillus sp. 3LSP]MDU0329579.1 HAMP domain-containing sensor histidine kinase [Paenibacillus sp. 3LSP]
MKFRPVRKFRKSLLTRYVLILGIAFVFIPVMIPISFIAAWGVNVLLNPDHYGHEIRPYGTGKQIEAAWHQAAAELKGAQDETIDAKLKEMKQRYPDAALYWVDTAGMTRLQLPEQASVPPQWSLEDTIAFMKQRVDADPFTVVAFIGGDEQAQQGFMVLELPRKYMVIQKGEQFSDNRFYGVFIAILLGAFVLLSYLFFSDIRKRLLRLEAGMTRPGPDGLPSPIEEGRPDEIGRLELAFNHMVFALKDSRQREREEEELRKSLISHLSHDLRTPLTVLGSHLYSLRQESLSEQGKQSLALMETKISDLSGLMDHLLSYNLLSSGRYAMSLERLDILRIVRESAAAWYPVWEKNGITADIELPEQPIYWNVDAQGFRRVLDNLFQNLVRHAGSGRYAGIAVEPYEGTTALTISDHGPGMESVSANGGAGLGLQIVDLLLREMGLTRATISSEAGTKVYIYPAAKLSLK